MLNQFFSLKNNQPTKIGANSHIQNQLHTLEIEKDIQQRQFLDCMMMIQDYQKSNVTDYY